MAKEFILQENVLSDNILVVPNSGKVFKGGYVAIIKENAYQNAWTDKEYLPHISSYFDICFESFFYNESETLSLTEKIFKPIINFQPFIFVATKGSLNLLRDLGFKTFEGFIDESYDNIENNDKRLFAAYEQIKKLCSMSKEEIHNWYWSMEEILIHNHNHLLQIHNNKMITETAFDALYERCR